jgi:type IV secretory pathway TraG/TraD family ATPase VirD4
MSSIRTQFRNLRDISGENKIISSTGNSLAETISSEKPTVLLFSLDTKAKKIQSAQVARMLISDLKQNDRIIRMNDDKANLMCIFDEFGSFATEDIVELQEQGRSFGFQIIYAIQTLSNLTKISADFATRVIGNCSTYITHRTRDNKAAEEIANLVATNPAFEGTERESEGEFTGERSVRAVEHYIHHPRQIKQLPDHYALIVTIENGEVTPIAEPIKIDYANIENFKLNKTEKINSEEDNLTEEFKNVGFAQNKARIMAKEHLERRNLK